jgi:(1->4)-alpha-D-glucan 1-alpha-D-glucosylmutase
MRSLPAVHPLEASGYSECLDRLSATGGVTRPVATYRLQFNNHFKFEDAERLLDYLQALGVTHVYSSPILKARAGSMHGYDIIDHNRINPELGGEEGFEKLCRALRQRGMGLVLDLVANHVGVNEDVNHWWQDVLENGRASEYANYFDIDWNPLKPELRDRLLLPVLGGQYGEELENGNLRLVYDEEHARVMVDYFGKRFPVDPHSYPLIFSSPRAVRGAPVQRDEAQPPEADLAELRTLLAEFGELPAHNSHDHDAIRLRRNRIPELRNRLLGILRLHPRLLEYFVSTIESFNGAPGDSQSFDRLHRLLEAQPYRLAHWKVSAEEINYRRFFDINDLVGLKMENPRVFAATHALIRRLLADGSVTGLRIDHPDGLYNPQQYFTRLQMLYCAAHCAGPEPHGAVAENGIEAPFQEIFGRNQWTLGRPPLYLIVEKILQPGEPLPSEWPVDGTVGYEFANLANGIFVDARAERPLTTLYRRFTGLARSPQEIVYASKRQIMKTALPSEVNTLTQMLSEISTADRHARDFTINALRDAIREVIASFPVYRTYIDERGHVSERDSAIIHQAVRTAKRQNASTPAAIFDFLRDVLLLKPPARGSGADILRQRLAFTLKFQQLTGPVMAKGLEDTAFYVYNRFIALNEVGGSPQKFGVTVDEFHEANRARAAHWAFSMLTTSTHDSKRSEDVRARLDVLSEMPSAWSATVNRWRRNNRTAKRTLADGRVIPDANEEYLLYQTLVGAAPVGLGQTVSESEIEDFRGRIQQYMFKAVHEAKINLSWINPDGEYVEALRQFIDEILASAQGRRRNNFWAQFTDFIPPIVFFGAMNSLAQTLLKITSPGMPDTYQGNELWDFSLVDPDNRRAVDFELRQKFLRGLQARADSGNLDELCRELLSNWDDGRVKLWTTLRALNFRREYAELFKCGSYVPLVAHGSKQEQICAFARVNKKKDEMAAIIVPRLSCTLMKGEIKPPLGPVWENTSLELPRESAEHFLNIFTGKVIATNAAHELACSEIFADFPVALLVAR